MSRATQLNLENFPADDAIKIPGLSYIPDYITADDHNQLLDIIDGQIWSTELKRRVQHYGYKYKYKKRSVDTALYLGALPNLVVSIAKRFYRDGLAEKEFDQVIINEYQPGQGIASHVDCVDCFADTIVSLSLGSVCVMEFTPIKPSTGGTPVQQQKIPLLLSPRSLLILKGAARYNWQHGIAARKKDKYEGAEFARSRRVSLTFRKVLLPSP